MLSSAPTPFSSIARSIAAADSGSAPAWYATPMSRKCAGVVCPKSAPAAANVSSSMTSRVDERMRSRSWPCGGNALLADPETIEPVATSVPETNACVRPAFAHARLRESLPVRRSSAR